MTPHDPVLTPREAAEMFGVRATTVARWARAGRLEPVRTPGGHRRYRLSEILALVGTDPAKLDAAREVAAGRTEADAARLYSAGWPIRRVAREFGVGYGTMRRVLKGHGVLRSQRRRADSPAVRKSSAARAERPTGNGHETGHGLGEERGALFPGPWPIVVEPKERRWPSDT